MATYSFRLPDIGEGVAEAEIVAWHVQVGDRIAEDQPLADMMTDKATVEMESPVAGIVRELAGNVGDVVAIGSALAVIETDDSDAEVVSESECPPEPVDVASPADIDPTPEPPASVNPVALPQVPQPAAEAQPVSRSMPASPAVRARAKDLGIDLADVKATSDRIRHADLDAYLRYGLAQGYRVPQRITRRPDEEVRVIGMRRRIAENMAASKRAIPHFTYVEEIDVTALEALRADLNTEYGVGSPDGRPKLTMLPLLIVAICRALPQFPMINGRYDDEAGVVTRAGAVHLGMATQTEAGLMVPVIRDAQDRNVWQLAAEIRRLADAARSGKAKSEELSGSTLTITSLGPLGGIVTTPVINRPEVAIIGPNKVIERPVIRDGVIAIAKLMNLSISCDHRVVDGWDAASFVQALKRLIETPVLLFAPD